MTTELPLMDVERWNDPIESRAATISSKAVMCEIDAWTSRQKLSHTSSVCWLPNKFGSQPWKAFASPRPHLYSSNTFKGVQVEQKMFVLFIRTGKFSVYGFA